MKVFRPGWAVAGFFIFYFLVLQFISDLQFYMEYGEDILDTIMYRLVTTPFSMLAYFFFYSRVVPLLLEKKYQRFLLCLILFIAFFEIFLHLLDWLIWQMPFLSDSSRTNAKNNWKNFQFPRQSFWLTFMHIFSISGFGYYMNRMQQEKIVRQLKEQHLQLELNYLKAQLHPHFFFNTLNNIYSLALYQSEKTPVVVERLSQLMRYIIYEGNQTLVPLQKEIEFLQNYVQLEKIRHEETVKISFSAQGKPENIQAPPLLFMPLMENAFKHGFTMPLQPGWMEASLLVDDKEITFQVKNSRSDLNNGNVAGIGLENLKKRLALLYPGKHSLEINETENQFEVNLTIRSL